ncbi:MAG: hypothetical protein JOY92_07745 [Verrucomicrobia bacterium]|nr:hypothetical protein [Verrucomicrobiota bacterium]
MVRPFLVLSFLLCVFGFTPWPVTIGTARDFWAARDARYVDRTAILTERGLRHIQERHWPDSDAPGAGKFADGITVRDLRDLIDEAVAKGRVRVNSHGRPGVVFEYDFGRPIGVNIQGEPASRLRVVVAPDHTVITAFPF